jgi:hypothetical protein
MSVFQVSLSNNLRGQLDPSIETQRSIQRSIYVAGPKGIRRQLKDGDTFTDCNYWKRFAYPQVSQQDAFLVVLEDDGSIYSDLQEENNFPRVYTLNVNSGSSYENNVIDIMGDNKEAARFVQIHNFDTSGNIKIRINGSVNAVFDLEAGNTQMFNYGDLVLTKLEFRNESETNSIVQVIASIKSSSKS